MRSGKFLKKILILKEKENNITGFALCKETILLLVLLNIVILSSCIYTDIKKQSGLVSTNASSLFNSDIISEEQYSISQSIELNKRALKLVEDKKYEEGCDFFEKAIELDDSNFEAHYNYAKTLTILKISGYFDMETRIIENLKKTISLKFDYLTIIKKEKLFEVLKIDYRYLKLLGYDINKTEDTLYVLKNLKWYIRSITDNIDIYGSLEFKNDGTFILWYYTPETIYSFGKKTDKYVYFGKYNVENDAITLSLNGRMLRKRNIETDVLENSLVYDDVTSFGGSIQESGEIRFTLFDYIFSWEYPANG